MDFVTCTTVSNVSQRPVLRSINIHIYLYTNIHNLSVLVWRRLIIQAYHKAPWVFYHNEFIEFITLKHWLEILADRPIKKSWTSNQVMPLVSRHFLSFLHRHHISLHILMGIFTPAIIYDYQSVMWSLDLIHFLGYCLYEVVVPLPDSVDVALALVCKWTLDQWHISHHRLSLVKQVPVDNNGEISKVQNHNQKEKATKRWLRRLYWWNIIIIIIYVYYPGIRIRHQCFSSHVIEHVCSFCTVLYCCLFAHVLSIVWGHMNIWTMVIFSWITDRKNMMGTSYTGYFILY